APGPATPPPGSPAPAGSRGGLGRLRLAAGTVWPLPFTLAVDDAVGSRLEPGQEIALRDGSLRLWGGLRISEIYRREPAHEAQRVYNTQDASHPGVAYLLARPGWLVAGDVGVLPEALLGLPFAEHRRTPRQLRAQIAA